MKDLYLLFDGSSVDGLGKPSYVTCTEDRKVAIDHYEACKKNPYSIGKVFIVTPDCFKSMNGDDL